MKPSRLFLITVAALSLSAGAASADIYTYTDTEGVVHFTNVPKTDGRYHVYIRGSGSHPLGVSGADSAIGPSPSDHDPGRYSRYDEWIREAATLYQIPEQLVRAVIRCESDYNPRAVSSAGARGLMQLMPDTAERMQVHDIDDPRENIFGGVRLLRILANTFNGDLQLTVAAYNAGDGAVMKYGGIPPYAQTRDYVAAVTRFYNRYRSVGEVAEASPQTRASTSQ